MLLHWTLSCKMVHFIIVLVLYHAMYAKEMSALLAFPSPLPSRCLSLHSSLLFSLERAACSTAMEYVTIQLNESTQYIHNSFKFDIVLPPFLSRRTFHTSPHTTASFFQALFCVHSFCRLFSSLLMPPAGLDQTQVSHKHFIYAGYVK